MLKLGHLLATIIFTDVSGKLVYQGKTNTNSTIITATDFADGLYLINVSNENVNYTTKFIKVK